MLLKSIVVLAVCLWSAFQIAIARTVEFSATAIQQFPQGQVKLARMNVGRYGVRREYTYHGQQVIEVYHHGKGMQYVILPAQKIYQVIESVARENTQKKSGKLSTSPCSGIKDEQCKFLKKEMVNGRLADKWEINRQIEGRKLKALIWVDVDRGQALRQFFPDGGIVETSQMGTETLGDRLTEKWVIKSSRPDGFSEMIFQWYDPELGIVIKEVLPGGYRRELKDIRMGTQTDELFEIPAGYSRVESIGTQYLEQTRVFKYTNE